MLSMISIALQHLVHPKQERELARRRVDNVAFKINHPGVNLPWVCPECKATVGEGQMTRSNAQLALAKHWKVQHPTRGLPKTNPSVLPTKSPNGVVVVPRAALEREPTPVIRGSIVTCPECGISVGFKKLASHLAKHEGKKQSSICSLCGIQLLPGQLQAHRRQKHPEGKNQTASIPMPRPKTIHVSPKLIECDLCGAKLRPDRVERHKKKHLKRHASPESPRRLSVRPESELSVCNNCGAHVLKEKLELHMRSVHSPVPQTPIERLPFTLLPAGTWDIRQVIDHYRRLAKPGISGIGARVIDFSRLEEIELLKPQVCFVGKESWLGYVVFEFRHSRRVVLECPVEGNATYVLSGNWKSMVTLTKAEMRSKFAAQHTKVVHKGDWLSRVASALRGVASHQ